MKKKLLDVTIVLSWIFILIAGCDTREVTGSNMREVGAQTIWAQVEKTAVIRVAEGEKQISRRPPEQQESAGFLFQIHLRQNQMKQQELRKMTLEW